MTLADGIVVTGFVLILGGLGAAFGWPWAAMVGGSLLMLGGARLQQQEKADR